MGNKRALVTVTWKPETYNKLSFAQKSAASKILRVLKIEEDAHILDVGCGDGKISAKLSKLAKEGVVLGLDKSSEMINFGIKNYRNKQYPNLKFSLQDAQEIDFKETFDLIFSSFALQWFCDKPLFFTKAHAALRNEGQICLVVPLSISPELECATQAVTESPQWYPFYVDFHPNWYFVEENNLLHLIKESCFELTYLSTYMQEISFPCSEDFEEYILLWFPYLAPLNESQKHVFFSQVLSEYYRMLPPKENGSVIMRIPVMSLIASKIR